MRVTCLLLSLSNRGEITEEISVIEDFSLVSFLLIQNYGENT